MGWERFAGGLLGAWLACWGASAAALPPAPVETPIDLSSSSSFSLGPHSYLYFDPEGALVAADLLAGRAGPAEKSGEEVNNFGVTRGARWLVTPLSNPTGQPVTRLLVLEPPWIDDLRVTLAGPDGGWHEQRVGTSAGFGARALPHRKLNLDLTIPPGESRLLLRVQSHGPLIVGATLWERSAFLTTNGGEAVDLALIYAILGAMLLFNLGVWLLTRDRAFGAYALYVASFLLLCGGLDGYLFRYVFPDSPRLAVWLNSAANYLCAAGAVHFMLQFLDLRVRMPHVHAAGGALLVAILLWMAVASVTTGFGWSSAGMWLNGAVAFAGLMLGVWALLAGNRAAIYFLVATAAGFLGSLVSVLALTGDLPFTFYTFHAARFGMLAETILLSIALADRLRLARAEAQHARTAVQMVTRLQAQQVEREVDRRTSELQAASAAKDRLFSIIAHDLRGSIRSLDLLFTQVIRSPHDVDDKVLAMTRSATASTVLLLEELLLWARAQRGEIAYAPQRVDLLELLKEAEALYQPEASAKGVKLQLDPGCSCVAYADLEMVKTILRNLVGNALKYTPAGGRISAAVSGSDAGCAVRICDTGAGIRQEEQLHLFDASHPSHAPDRFDHHGLGLILCREFVERHGGTIVVESCPGEGTAFTFTLPRVPAGPGAAREPSSDGRAPSRLVAQQA